MKDTYVDLFENEEKAIDHACWLNFKYRIAKITFGVMHGSDNNWAVCEQATADEMERSFLDILPTDYAEMTYRQIRHIKMDTEPLPHWADIVGEIATMDGEILRYLLHAKIPLEKLIRYELAMRGYDKNHRWCGFEKAEEVWLEEKK